MNSSVTGNPHPPTFPPAQNGFPAPLMRTIGILFAWFLFPLALQRVLYPSLGKLKIIFINDSVIFVGVVLAAIGESMGYRGEALIIVGGIPAIISIIIVLVFTIIDMVKLYINKVS